MLPTKAELVDHINKEFEEILGRENTNCYATKDHRPTKSG